MLRKLCLILSKINCPQTFKGNCQIHQWIEKVIYIMLIKVGFFHSSFVSSFKHSFNHKMLTTLNSKQLLKEMEAPRFWHYPGDRRELMYNRSLIT